MRLLHWTLALSMIASFITHEGGGRLHEWTGYLALAAASVRVAMGLAGSGYWRFSQFFTGVGNTWAYGRAVWAQREPRYLGHNPLGGWMVLALLADALATGLTGWLYTTDRFGDWPGWKNCTGFSAMRCCRCCFCTLPVPSSPRAAIMKT